MAKTEKTVRGAVFFDAITGSYPSQVGQSANCRSWKYWCRL